MILKKVISDDNGLIGILSNGDKVPLSTPKIDYCYECSSGILTDEDEKEFLEESIEEFEKIEDEYFQMGKCTQEAGVIFLPYNEYTLRK